MVSQTFFLFFIVLFCSIHILSGQQSCPCAQIATTPVVTGSPNQLCPLQQLSGVNINCIKGPSSGACNPAFNSPLFDLEAAQQEGCFAGVDTANSNLFGTQLGIATSCCNGGNTPTCTVQGACGVEGQLEVAQATWKAAADIARQGQICFSQWASCLAYDGPICWTQEHCGGTGPCDALVVYALQMTKYFCEVAVVTVNPNCTAYFGLTPSAIGPNNYGLAPNAIGNCIPPIWTGVGSPPDYTSYFQCIMNSLGSATCSAHPTGSATASNSAAATSPSNSAAASTSNSAASTSNSAASSASATQTSSHRQAFKDGKIDPTTGVPEVKQVNPDPTPAVPEVKQVNPEIHDNVVAK